MSSNAMGWWYWFGMQIFGIASLVLTWWLFLDASRRKGTPTRFVWPIVSLAGLLMQIPAFAVAEANQANSTGTSAAILGVFGLIVVSLAAITHFYKGPSSGGTGWSMRTRDENSSSRSTSDRRRTRAPQASVAVPTSGQTRPRNAPPSSSAVTPTADKSALTSKPVAVSQPSEPPVVPADISDARRPVHPKMPETLTDEPTVTLADEGTASTSSRCPDPPSSATAFAAESTLMEDAAPGPTLIDDGRTIMDELDGPRSTDTDSPRLVITDGKTSRVIISEHSGAFIVGRDPSRSALAVDDARASRAHFSIAARDGGYFLQDMGSSNGTFVNGALVTAETALRDGDTIEFGRTVATFRMPA